MSAVEPLSEHEWEPPVYRLTVDIYHRMIEAGILGKDDKLELIDGELRVMPPINPGHSGKCNRLSQLFYQRAEGRAILSVQAPLVLPEFSEPEPDLMLLRPRADFYEGSHPMAADILLVVEVADSSLAYDRKTKCPLYAAHGVPEVWLIDLRSRRIELFRDPGLNGYRQVLIPDDGQSISPQLLPEVIIAVAELWA